jgi:hypothetical protein
MLRRFAEEIWTAEGPCISVAGFDYPTRMVVIRLSDGALFIWSPTALSHDLRSAVDLLGPVRHIVAPNTLHHNSSVTGGGPTLKRKRTRYRHCGRNAAI